MKIGKKLREIRKRRNMTLQDLSQKSSVALATLSRIENDKMTGTLESHLSICKTLGVSITELYGQLEEEAKLVAKLPPSERVEHYKQSDKATYQLLVPKQAEKKIRPVLITIAPGGKTVPERSGPNTEKFAYLIKGDIVAVIGKKEYNLKKGDSLYFDASLENRFKNASSRDAELITILAETDIS